MDELERRKNISFLQAEGLAELPGQLKRAEVSKELRSLLWFSFHQFFEEYTSYHHVEGPVEAFLFRMHVVYLHGMADEFKSYHSEAWAPVKRIFQHSAAPYVYDFLQWSLRQPEIAVNLSESIAIFLKRARAAYRIADGDTLVPVGSEEEANAIEHAMTTLSGSEFQGTSAHLKSSAAHLTGGRFADSIRESAHAIESTVRSIEGSSDLSKALKMLEMKGRIHPALKKGFESIYAYTSDEKGIRHALLDKGDAAVDEADALFMLGAASTFVTYLLSKSSD